MIKLINEFKFLFEKLPYHIIFYPTSRCNARCSHCYNFERESDSSKKAELSIEEIKKISDSFGHVKVLTISGGEPFLRNDIEEIISIFYNQNGLQYVSIHTNAFLEEKVTGSIESILKKFKDLNVIVCISIDGAGKLHDEIRGVLGGFDKVVNTINQLESLKENFNNLFIVSSTMFSNSTENTFEDTYSFIKSNFKYVKPSISLIRGKVQDDREKNVDISKYIQFFNRNSSVIDKSSSFLSPMSLKETLELMINKVVVRNFVDKKQIVPCQAGRKLVVIYENGEVFPCESLKEGFGNLRDVDYDITKLVFSKKGKAIRKKINPGKACYCTWENIIPVNLLFNLGSYKEIIKTWFNLFIINKF